MKNVREVFEKHGKNASKVSTIKGSLFTIYNNNKLLAIPVKDIVDDIGNSDNYCLIDLQDFGVCGCNEDGDVWFIQREFSKNRYVDLTYDGCKDWYLCYIDFGNDKFDIVLCDKVVF